MRGQGDERAESERGPANTVVDPRLRVHFYGKDLRPGRKVGHVNAYGDDLEDCLERARHAAAWFRGDLGNESE